MVEQNNQSHGIMAYWPLFALIMIAILAAFALQLGRHEGMQAWMHYFMGVFFIFFAALKIFDLPGFADGFVMYDLLAKEHRWYAYVYPFIELLLGLAYLGFFVPIFTYLVTIGVMAFSAVGVINGLRAGIDIYCPCMGSVLKVPLSTVTLTEDIGMGVMGLILLLTWF
jgi:hypothetical protein